MKAFAMYRLPYDNQYARVEQAEGEPLKLRSLALLNGKQGFVFAPFAPSDEEPIYLIQGPTTVAACPEGDGEQVLAPLTERETTPDGYYQLDFASFSSQVLVGNFSKLVLSRCIDIVGNDKHAPEELFFRACVAYPRMFISLVHIPQEQTWLMATPELLLEGSGDKWRTIALAGTMELRAARCAPQTDQWVTHGQHKEPSLGEVGWSDKNIREQRLVSTYIVECLEHYSTNIHEEGPRTIRAGHLLHLRSDFTFSVTDPTRLGSLLAALHPTPAVCGLPKREAFDFICKNESAPRQYYSGFCGPLSDGVTIDGTNTHLFVSLRCMQILPDSFRLYAGGGILPESILQQEWNETETKLDTMRRLL
ncbi:MAG: chorismate-binding protein [Prevotella sp.]|nr:chorismate-binding protein [Prevotella sp.]